MRESVIVSDHGDVAIFLTRAAAELCLEADDVRHEAYVVYDPEGRRLEARIEKVRVRYFVRLLETEVERVVLEPTESEPGHVAELKAILHAYLGKVDPSGVPGTNETLPVLIERASRYALTR